MTFIQDNAYILHKRKYKETSILADVFTLEYGRIPVVVKGASSSSSNKWKSSLNYFTLLNLGYRDRYYKYLSFAEPLNSSHYFVGNKLACALYVNELLTYSLPYQHAYQELFCLYAALLIELEQSTLDALDVKLRIFEKQLLSLLGYHYRFDATCDSEPIEQHQFYQFVPGHGFMESLFDSRNRFVGRILLNIAKDDYTEALTRKQAKQIMRMAIQHLTGNKVVKSRKLFLMNSSSN